MERIPSSPPAILPVTATARPLWSVMIPVYNCIQFLAETLNSVLLQALPEGVMQIEVVDDASTDGDVAALVLELGKGRIRYFRQCENVGSLRNFQTCINRAEGRLVHLLHGDDRVHKGYYEEMGRLFRQFPEAGAAFCRFAYIDGDGKLMYLQPPEAKKNGLLDNWLLRIAERNRIQYAAITVRRDVYEKLGGFYGVTYCEDWEMWVRIAKDFPVAYTPHLLADYRKHRQSITGQKFLTGSYLKDIACAMNEIQQYLPEKTKKRVLKRSKHFYALYATRVINDLWHTTHDRLAAKSSLETVVAMHSSLQVYWAVLKLYTKMLVNRR